MVVVIRYPIPRVVWMIGSSPSFRLSRAIVTLTVLVNGSVLSPVGDDTGEKREPAVLPECGSPIMTLIASDRAVVKAGTLDDPSWVHNSDAPERGSVPQVDSDLVALDQRGR